MPCREKTGRGREKGDDDKEKTYPILLVKDTRKSPRLVLKRLDIHDLDEQDIARRGALDLERAREVVNFSEVYVPDVVGVIRVLDLATGPFICQSVYATGRGRGK